MRTRTDPRLAAARAGQVEFRKGPSRLKDAKPWDPIIACPLGGYLADPVVLRDRPPFVPYRWRDPRRARAWHRLPADLIAQMAAEDTEPLPIAATGAQIPDFRRRPAMGVVQNALEEIKKIGNELLAEGHKLAEPLLAEIHKLSGDVPAVEAEVKTDAETVAHDAVAAEAPVVTETVHDATAVAEHAVADVAGAGAEPAKP